MLLLGESWPGQPKSVVDSILHVMSKCYPFPILPLWDRIYEIGIMSSQAHYQVKQRWHRSLVKVGRSLLVDYDIYAKIDGRPPNGARGLGDDPVCLGRDSIPANLGKIREDNISNGVPELLCIGNIF
ncbi:hypothetical protein EDC04DRAFT_2600088 [Pisolithus marmoratus]|nr:hypothetical protein EDC04DRAFT_2600088 [Pisolithus marmoratus]